MINHVKQFVFYAIAYVKNAWKEWPRIRHVLLSWILPGFQWWIRRVANALIQATQAGGLLGAQVVLTGIGPTMTQTLVYLGADLSSSSTRANLQSAIGYALQ